MAEIILHQYDTSPFSEKVRLCLGIKNLAWSAVDQPVIMPKPDLVPLTGGYRRIPVMQIGADVYCDSALIVREIERRCAGPALFPKGLEGFTATLEHWADKGVFQAVVIAIFGTLGDAVDPAFVKDREALSGQPFNTAAMKAMAPFALAQVKAHAALIAQQFADGRPFLAGEVPGLADAAAYYNFWFIRSFSPGAADSFPALPLFDAWYARVKAIGHGNRSAMTPAEALDVARMAEPEPIGVEPGEEALLGRPVSVAATDYGRDPIAGTFAGSTPFSVAVLREESGLGRIAVHVPRIGYAVTPG